LAVVIKKAELWLSTLEAPIQAAAQEITLNGRKPIKNNRICKNFVNKRDICCLLLVSPEGGSKNN